MSEQLRLKALEIAIEEIGVEEIPKGSNWGDDVKKYLKSTGITVPAPWCAAYVYWCIEKACRELHLPHPLDSLKHKAYVPSYINWANEKRSTRRVPRHVHEPGAIFLIHNPRKKRFAHMGFVEGVSDDGKYIITVEGNTNAGGQREGYQVVRRKRKSATLTIINWWDEAEVEWIKSARCLFSKWANDHYSLKHLKVVVNRLKDELEK